MVERGRLRVSFAWGPVAAVAAAPEADYAVVVDVLSFTTTLSVALDRGIEVFPYSWRDEQASAFAAEHDAVLAMGRLEAAKEGHRGVSLSPAAMAGVEGVERLVLPSPNGSKISRGLHEAGATVVGAALRNRTAVASWLVEHASPDASVVLVAAGERWPDGSLRPAVEDLWGVGAVVAALVDRDACSPSPEARAAEAAFRAVEPRLHGDLVDCFGGRELSDRGFGADVDIAAQLDASAAVPLLGARGSFADAGRR